MTVAVQSYRNSHITYSSDSSSRSKSKNTPSSKSTSKPKQGTPAKSKSKVFPQNPKDMDEILGKKGKPVKDGPTTQGRNKIKWELPDDIRITHEKHPYDFKAPDFHKGPHYHVDGPGYDHVRFMPGDLLPNIF